MRLSEIRKVFKSCLPAIKSFYNNSGIQGYLTQSVLIGIEKGHTITINLQNDQIEAFGYALNLIKQTNTIPKFINKEPFNAFIRAYILEGNWNPLTEKNILEFTQDLERLTFSIEGIIHFLDSILPEEKSNFVDLKLPNSINTLEELEKTTRLFNQVFNPPLLDSGLNGHLKLELLEPGSKWLKTSTENVKNTLLIAAISWSAAVVFNKVQEGRLTAEQVRALGIHNDHLQAITDAQKAQLNLLVEAEAEHIRNEYYTEKTPENLERLKHSINTMAELISKGAEVRPSLVAPETVENLFPNFTNLGLIESKIKRLNQTASQGAN